jgi:hypothetical protein
MRTSLGACVVAALLLVAPSFAAAPPSAAKHHHTITGKVLEVDHGQKGHGKIKIEVHHHSKAPAVNNGDKNKHHVVTVTVNHETHFDKIIHTGGKGGETREVSAHFHDVKPGEHVRVKVGHEHHAREVSIIVEHHRKK